MSKRAIILSLVLTIILAVGLFQVKYQVQRLEGDLKALNEGIAEDKRATHTLRAEWSHLNDLERIRRLAQEQLDMTPVAPEQVAAPGELPHRKTDQTLPAANKEVSVE